MITDAWQCAIAWSSAGALGFKGSRKLHHLPPKWHLEAAAKSAQEHGLKSAEAALKVQVLVESLGALAAAGLEVTGIRD